jgi:hypothetical protein
MDQKKLNPQLKKHLEALQETPARDPQQKDQGRMQFLRQAQAMQPQRKTSLWEQIVSWLGGFQGTARKRWAVTLAGIAAALILTLASVGGTVYASQNSLPGDALYPVKTLTEKVQLRLEHDPEDRIQLYSSFAHRRILEIQVMLEKGEPVPHSALNRLEQHTERMLQETASLQEQQLEHALQQIQTNLQEQSQAVDRIHQSTPEEADPGLAQAKERIKQRIELIASGLENPHSYQEKLKQNRFKPDHEPGKPEETGRPEHPGGKEADQDQPGNKPENPGNGNGGPENGRPEHPGQDGNGQNEPGNGSPGENDGPGNGHGPGGSNEGSSGNY